MTGQEKALARALAMVQAEDNGVEWLLLDDRTKSAYENVARQRVKAWVQLGVLTRFRHDYREATKEKPDPVTGK